MSGSCAKAPVSAEDFIAMIKAEADGVSRPRWHQHRTQAKSDSGDSGDDDQGGAAPSTAQAAAVAGRAVRLQSVRVFYVPCAQTEADLAALAALQAQGVACSLLPAQRLGGGCALSFLAWFTIEARAAEPRE